MVSKRMGSHGADCNSNSHSNSTGGTLIQTRDPKLNPLGRQGSVYNLTLDEVQSQLGDLSEKTADEVWHDIQQGHKRNFSLDRKVTLGEITLEDFLVKEGVVAEKKNSGFVTGGVNVMGVPVPTQQAQWMNPSIVGSLLSDTQLTPGRKRFAPVEKGVERRQKRMIKNRESAAKSRARKQAYTHELEIKVSRLEEENERLKRQKVLEDALSSIPAPEPKYQLRRTSSGPV